MNRKNWLLILALVVWTCGGGRSVLGACDGDNPDECEDCQKCEEGSCVDAYDDPDQQKCCEEGGEWNEETGECCKEDCGTSCGFGSGSGGTKSFKFEFSLGKDRWDGTAGKIFIHEAVLSPRVFTPVILNTKHLDRDAQLIKEGGVLRQILVNQGLVDVVTNGVGGF